MGLEQSNSIYASKAENTIIIPDILDFDSSKVIWSKRFVEDYGFTPTTSASDCEAGFAVVGDFLVINKVNCPQTIYVDAESGEVAGTIDLSSIGYSATGYLNNYRMTSDDNGNILISSYSKDNNGVLTVWRKKGIFGAIEQYLTYSTDENVGTRLSVSGSLDGNAIITASISGSGLDFFRWIVKNGVLESQTPERIHITGYEGVCWGNAEVVYTNPSDTNEDYITAAYIQFANDESTTRSAAYVNGATNEIISHGSRAISSNWIINAADVVDYKGTKYAVHNSINIFTWGADDNLYIYDLTNNNLSTSPIDFSCRNINFISQYGSKSCGRTGFALNGGDVKFSCASDGNGLNVFFEYCNGYVGCVRIPNLSLENEPITYGNFRFYQIPEGNNEVRVDYVHGDSCPDEIVIPSHIFVNNQEYTVRIINSFSHLDCTSIVIPQTITTINNLAFNRCKNLTSLVIPNSVTTIGYGAFWNCSSLTSVFIPASVTEIGIQAFGDLSSLKDFTIDDSNENYCTVDGAIYNKYKSEIIQCPAGKTGDYIIPETVSTIGYEAFYKCVGLTNVKIPNSVTIIGKHAFWHCSNLGYIEIPNSVTLIDEFAFYDCSGLASIEYMTDNPINDVLGSFFSTDVYENAELIIPIGTKDIFLTTSPWNRFSKIVEKENTGINDIVSDEVESINYNVPFEVYNLNGIFIGDNVDELSIGLYIIRQGNIVKKIAIK